MTDIIELAKQAGFEASESEGVFATGEYSGDAVIEIGKKLTKFAQLLTQNREDVVDIPKTADKAELMLKVGLAWLQVNAPDRLTQGGAVAKVLFRKDEDGLEPISFYSNDEYPKNEELKDRFVVMDVYLYPKDTQQKLDKAREILKESHCPNKNCNNNGVIAHSMDDIEECKFCYDRKQALKDIDS